MKTQEIARMKWSTMLIAFGLAALSLGVWEVYCRSQLYQVAPNDDQDLWASQRAKLDKLNKDDVVIIGSSRAMFNFQLDEWQKATGKLPVNLAAAGSTVLPVLEDVVENSSFNGTLIVGVTPGLYWVPQIMDVIPYSRITKWVDHYHNRTYADRFNHFISINGPQKAFSFLTATSEIFYNELDLRTLIERIPVEKRVPGPPPFPILFQIDENRNVSLMPQVTTDTTYANEITNFWFAVFVPPSDPNVTPEMIEGNRKAIIDKSVELLNKFKARGGKVILVRNPSQSKLREVENTYTPRAMYWDELVKATDASAYHFEDYPFMNQYILPEWSHMATDDAKLFTIEFINQLKKDNNL